MFQWLDVCRLFADYNIFIQYKEYIFSCVEARLEKNSNKTLTVVDDIYLWIIKRDSDGEKNLS